MSLALAVAHRVARRMLEKQGMFFMVAICDGQFEKGCMNPGQDSIVRRLLQNNESGERDTLSFLYIHTYKPTIRERLIISST